jgi:hypothetical protein
MEPLTAIHTVRAEEEAHGRPGAILACWTALLGGPAAWLLQLMVGYLFVSWAHFHDHSWIIGAVTATCLLLALGCVALAGYERRRARGLHDAIASERTRLMSTIGIGGGLFFALVIIAQGLALLYFSPRILGAP